MRTLSRLMLALVLIAAFALLHAPHGVQARGGGGVIQNGCDFLNTAQGGTFHFPPGPDENKITDVLAFAAGDRIDLAFQIPTGVTADYLEFQVGDPAVMSWSDLTSDTNYSYTFSTDMETRVGITTKNYDGQFTFTIQCSHHTPVVPPTEPTTTTNPVPGPDMITIPSSAVVGTFLADSPLYFAPELSAVSTFSMHAGQTLWVFGISEEGDFYQVVLAGQKLWVPVAVLSPTNAGFWHGEPLPDDVVQ